MAEDERARAARKSRRWKTRRAELDQAAAAAAASVRRAQETDAQQLAQGYRNTGLTWIGIAVAIVIGLVGWYLARQLGNEAKLEECIALHRVDCGTPIGDGR